MINLESLTLNLRDTLKSEGLKWVNESFLDLHKLRALTIDFSYNTDIISEEFVLLGKTISILASLNMLALNISGNGAINSECMQSIGKSL